MPSIRINTTFNIALDFESAELPRRIMAYLVDFTLLVLYLFSMKLLLYESGLSGDSQVGENYLGLELLLVSLPMMLYFPVSEILMHGQSVGKHLWNLRIISLDGDEPSVGQYLVRWMFRVFEWPFFFGYLISSGDGVLKFIFITFILGFVVLLIILFTPKNQRLGDLAANTVVVMAQQSYSVKDTLFVPVQSENYKVRFPEVLKLSDRDVNTIHRVLSLHYKNPQKNVCDRLSEKVKSVLHIQTDMDSVDFLKTLLLDYNYLATR